MQKQSIQVEVCQEIHYTGEAEPYRQTYRVPAALYELKSYSKIVYSDLEQQLISIKWYHPTQLEISQPNGLMRFVLNQSTPYYLNSGTGQLLFTIHTHQLKWIEPQESQPYPHKQLELFYQVATGDEIIGNYVFRLIYQC